jgi:4-carboxymuconolactone decarboxylase
VERQPEVTRSRSYSEFKERIVTMKRMRPDDISPVRDQSPMFIGEVTRQVMVSDDDADLLRVTLVAFKNGARNRLHHHEADQVLVVTEGRGIVATEGELLEVALGDVILIPAGERHWHGAAPGADFAHLSILTPGAMTIDEGVPA